jgi:hypothetical protein
MGEARKTSEAMFLNLVALLLWISDRLRQDDSLLRLQLQGLGQRGLIDAGSHHRGKPLEGAVEINVLRNESHVGGGEYLRLGRSSVAGLGKVRDIHYLHRQR